MPAPLIWHVTTRCAWEDAVNDGEYTISTRGKSLADVGFVHACWPEQISVVAKRLFPDRPDDLVILEIDAHRVEESGIAVDVEEDTEDPSGISYPHIRGPLPIAAVVRLRGTKWIGREFVVVA